MKLVSYLFLAISLSVLHTGVYAETAVKCHCFRDRIYDSHQKFASDEYILATSFNSLMAKGFGIAKRQIVMLKMKGGVNQYDLLVALFISQATGNDVNQLLNLNKNMSWQTILSDWQISENKQTGRVVVAIRKGVAAKETAAMIADQLLIDFFNTSKQSVEQARAYGLNEKEMALVFILSHASQLKPAELTVQYTEQGKSWSEIAQELGVAPVDAGKLIMNYPEGMKSE